MQHQKYVSVGLQQNNVGPTVYTQNKKKEISFPSVSPTLRVLS